MKFDLTDLNDLPNATTVAVRVFDKRGRYICSITDLSAFYSEADATVVIDAVAEVDLLVLREQTKND